jgi:hypothetical protein
MSKSKAVRFLLHCDFFYMKCCDKTAFVNNLPLFVVAWWQRPGVKDFLPSLPYR